MEYQFLLVARFFLLNAFCIALTLAAYGQGWLDGILAARLSELSLIIVAVFVYGVGNCGWRIWRTSIELNGLAADDLPADSKIQRYIMTAATSDSQSRSIQAGALRLKLTDRIVAVRHIANSLIFLGLIGTVIGFIIALSGVDPDVASEVENVAAVVSTLIDGMSVALNTTLIGAVFYLWLTMNYRILTSGTVSLISEIIEVGERRASTG